VQYSSSLCHRPGRALSCTDPQAENDLEIEIDDSRQVGISGGYSWKHIVATEAANLEGADCGEMPYRGSDIWCFERSSSRACGVSSFGLTITLVDMTERVIMR